jgi:tripartite-type tricarboxylate transporter receptor subunit TctC
VVNPSLYRNAPYDPFKDFSYIAVLGSSPNLICARAETGITSLAQLIEQAKADPNRFNYASPGIGTTPHLAGEVLKLRTGINLQHVPFSGAGPAVQAVLAGTTELLIASQGGQVEVATRSGALRILAQTAAQRAPGLENIPTLAELGIRDAVSETFNGLYAPAGTPQAVIDKVAAAALQVLGRPDVKDRYRLAGVNVVAGGPTALRDRVAHEVPLWRQVIESAGIRVE